MRRRSISLALALILTFLLFYGCAPVADGPKAGEGTPAFAADFLGVYYITRERTVCFLPFSEEKAAGYGHETGIMSGLSDITAICAEGDGHIGAVDSAGTYHTTCDIQPERAEDFIPDGENIGAGYGQLVSAAQDFSGLSDISFFRSAYPTWGLFVRKDGSVTVPGADEASQKILGDWENVIQLAGGQDVIALTAEGTVLCMPDSPYKSTYESWTDVSALYSDHATDVFAVTDKGDVRFSGENQWGEGDVDDWHNIVSIAAAPSFTVGLCSDGTVVAAGSNDCGQCDVADWTDIVAVAVSSSGGAAGATYTAGLDRDGNLWVTGKIQGVSYHGIYKESAALDYLHLSR